MPTWDSCEYRANQQYSNPDNVLEYVDLSECDWTLGNEMSQWYCLFMRGVGSGFWPMYDNQPDFDYTPDSQYNYIHLLVLETTVLVVDSVKYHTQDRDKVVD